MDENQKKQMQKELLVKMMEGFLKSSPYNVPQPLPVIEEKAENHLSTDDLISWKVILKEWQKVSAEGKKEISKLLVLNSYDIVETIDIGKVLGQEASDTTKYVSEHPEWGKSSEELKTQNIMESLLKDLEES